jgi:PAS domain S-box-containing protein
VLDDLLRAVESQSGNSMKTSVLVLSEDGQFMLHGAGPALPPGYNQAVHGIPIGEGIGSCGTAVARRAPVYVHDIASDPLWKDYANLAVSYGLRSCWSMPIKGADGEVLGTFAIYYSEPRAPTPGDVDAINVIAQTAALAIERHRSDINLVRSQEKLRLLNADLERRVHERARERSRTWLVSPDLLSVINADGKFDAVNPAWTATLGWSEEELLSGLESLVHPDDAARSAAVFHLARQGRPITQFRNRYRHRNGSYRSLVWVVVLEEENSIARPAISPQRKPVQQRSRPGPRNVTGPGTCPRNCSRW